MNGKDKDGVKGFAGFDALVSGVEKDLAPRRESGPSARTVSPPKSPAAQGNADAQAKLGQLYADGQGVPQDYAKARQCWEKAAAQGNAHAQAAHGTLYYGGRGVPQDY